MEHFARACAAAGVWLAALACATAACAQDTDIPTGSIQVTANASVVSDYRFRGISLSNRDPAIQGGIDVVHDSGLFVGTWASSIQNTAGSDAEVDLYAGYGKSLGGVDYSVQFLGYIYPGGSGVDYFELSGTAGKTIGPASFQLQLAYVPSQANSVDNIYVAARADIALSSTPLKLRLRGGYEGSSFMKKWDWETGVSYSWKVLTASVSYVDSNYDGPTEAGRNGGAGVVASLTATF